MRRMVMLAAGAAIAASVALAAGAQAKDSVLPAGPVTVAIVQDESVPAPGPAAHGIGVNPASRDGLEFLAAVSAGAPSGDVTALDPGRAGALADLLGDAGVRVEATGPLGRLMLTGTREGNANRDGGLDGDRTLRVVDGGAADAAIVLTLSWDGSTPVDVRIAQPAPSILTGGQSRRPSIVTPYDITATILSHFDVRIPKSFVGRTLTAEPRSDAVALTDRIRHRLLRDVSFMQSLTAYTIVLGLGFGWLLAWITAIAGKREWSQRLTVGASTVTTGFLIGLFVPSARGDVRVIPMLVLFVAVAAWPWRDRETAAMRFFVVATGATAVLAVLAATDPGGIVAHALWGNPLVSWRFFGLQNFAAAFIAGGAVVAATRLGLRALPLGLLCAASIVIVGSPRIGANFVAVLTFAFGAAVAVTAVRAQALRPGMVAAAAGIAVAAFALALLADAGSASSHGGAAAQEIGRGGIGAAWDLAMDRLRLNVRAINAFPGGWAWVVAFLGLYAAMIRAAWTRDGWPVARRAAVTAGALAGLAALALEDSGFKTTAVLGFPALLLWTLAEAGRPLFPRKTAGQRARA